MDEKQRGEQSAVPSVVSPDFIYDKFFTSIDKFSTLAEKGPSHTLLTIGMAILAICLLTKVKIRDMSILYLDQAEFITFALIGLASMLAGAGVRVYQFRVQVELERERNTLGFDLLSGTQELAKSLVTPQESKKDDNVQL